MSASEPMAAGDGGTDAESAQKVTRKKRFRALLARAVEWATRRQALAEARRAEVLNESERRALGHARDAVSAGDRLLDPPDGSLRRPELAMALFREAAHWLLRALTADLRDEGPLAERLARAHEHVDPAAGSWLSTHPLPPELVVSSSEFIEYSREARLTAARACQRWLHLLLERLTVQHEARVRLKFERLTRCIPLAVAMAALVLLLALGVVRLYRGPDLAAGKPWRTSSTYVICRPDLGTCGGANTKIFFHTSEEEHPWFEVDLLSPRRVQRVEVENRQDSDAAERAVPLLLELSLDGKKYSRVAQKSESFTTWNVNFAKQEARYVRLTVARRSTLHLERVSVRP